MQFPIYPTWEDHALQTAMTITKQIWMWCKENAVWISVSHIPGIMNTEADMLSRQFNDHTEWKLSPDISHKVTDRLLKPDIDLFASRLNFQMKPFISWGPDPEALAINAFTQNWSKWLIYAFLPFSLLQKVLSKWQKDGAEGILIVPKWPTAVWYPQMLKMLTREPVLLPSGKRTISVYFTRKLLILYTRSYNFWLASYPLASYPQIARSKRSSRSDFPSYLGILATVNKTAVCLLPHQMVQVLHSTPV